MPHIYGGMIWSQTFRHHCAFVFVMMSDYCVAQKNYLLSWHF